MRASCYVPMLFVLVAGCAGSSANRVAAPAPRVAARLMTPQGPAPAADGTVALGADPRFAVRLDSEAPAYIYLMRCGAGPCALSRSEPQLARPGVPLLLAGPGGWLTMNGARSEEVRVLAAAEPLSPAELDERAQPMARREPETATPDKRGLDDIEAHQDQGVSVLTVLLIKNQAS